jgi:hypothetical protein
MTKDARMLTGIAWNVVVEYAVLMAATIAMLGARVLEMPEGRLEWMATFNAVYSCNIRQFNDMVMKAAQCTFGHVSHYNI